MYHVGKQLILLCLFLCLTVIGKGEDLNFQKLDSTFTADAGVSTQKELETLLLEIRGLAQTPLELGKTELLNSTFHSKGTRYGLALMASQKATVIFDSLGNQELTIAALVQQVKIYHTLGDARNVTEIVKRLDRFDRKTLGPTSVINILRTKSLIKRYQGRLDSAHFFAKKAIEIALEEKDSSEYTLLMFSDAISYQLEGKPKESLAILSEIKPSLFTVRDYNLQIHYFNFLGMVLMSVKQNENANAAYEEAIKVARDHDLKWTEGIALNSLAIGLKAVGDTTGAIQRFEEALSIGMELNQLGVISSVCSGLADIYIGQKKWELADEYSQLGLDYSRQTKEIRMESYALMRVAMVKMHYGENQEALTLLQIADSLTHIMGNWARIRTINELRSEASENKGDMEQALAFQRLAIAAQDSVEFLEAKMYADSLGLNQTDTPIASTQTEVERKSRKGWTWALIIFALMGFAGLVGWKFRKTAKEEKPRIDTPSENQPESEAIPNVILSLKNNKDWAGFMLQFDSIYPGLMETMAHRHPDITPTDLRILALSRLGLSIDEFGELLAISRESAKKARYRTRKRLGVPQGQSLMQYMMQG